MRSRRPRTRHRSMRRGPQLLTYPDSLGGTIADVARLLRGPLAGHFAGVHILPPFPSSGDRGFAPIDYRRIEPRFGTWEDIAEGREGQYRVRLMDNLVRGDCAYPGVERLPDGTFVVTTYGHWTEGEEPYVVSVRLTLAELDAKLGRAGR